MIENTIDFNMEEMKEGHTIHKRDWKKLYCVIGNENYQDTLIEMEKEYGEAINHLQYAQRVKNIKYIPNIFKPDVTAAKETVDKKCTKLSLLYNIMQKHANKEINSSADLQKAIEDFIKIYHPKKGEYGYKLDELTAQLEVFEKRTFNILEAINVSLDNKKAIDFLPDLLKKHIIKQAEEASSNTNNAFIGF